MCTNTKKFGCNLKKYVILCIMAAFIAQCAVPVLAAPSQKAVNATVQVTNDTNEETINNYVKIMLKEAKRANRAKCYDEAADYLRGALYFLRQNPESETYKKAIADLNAIIAKSGADADKEARMELAKSTYMEGRFFASAYEFLVLLEEGYKPDVCYEYLGEIARELKSEQSAFIFFKKAVETNPDNISAKYRFANALLRKGMESDAIYYFEDVIKNTNSSNMVNEIINTFKARLELNPDDENNYGVLGLAYQRLGQYDKTYQYLKHSLVLNPDDTFLRYYLANLLFNIKEYAFADEIYSEILEDNPYESQIRISRAKTYVSMNNYEKALNDYRVVLAMYPDSIQAQYGIYTLLKDKMPLDKIISSFYPLEPDYKLNAEGYESIGYLANKMGSALDAAVFFEKAYELNPKSETIYIELYKVYQLLGQNEKAKAILQKGYKLFPNNQEIIDIYSSITSSKTDEKNNIALSYLNEGEYEKAISIYSQIEPKTAETYIAIANCYKQLGNIKNAILNYKSALSIDPSNSETYYALGLAYLEANSQKSAKTAFETSLKKNPANIKAKKMLAYIEQQTIGQTLDLAYEFYEKGEYGAALKYLDNAAQTFPNDPKAFYYRGLTKAAMGSFNAAIADFRKTIEIDRNYVDAYYSLAENLERVNRKKEALFMYEKYLGAENIDEGLAQKAQSRVLDLGERYY